MKKFRVPLHAAAELLCRRIERFNQILILGKCHRLKAFAEYLYRLMMERVYFELRHSGKLFGERRTGNDVDLVARYVVRLLLIVES